MNPARNPCRACLLGRMEYLAAWTLQQRLVLERNDDRIQDTLLILEHPPTFTLGKKTEAAHLLVDEATIRARGASVVRVDRGGDVTFHGPGQLVGYPIISLAGRPGGAGRYMRNLEDILIRALDDFGIQAGRIAGLTGVWVGDEKIAAIGARINVKRVTSHGFALNVSTDLSYFDWIIPCGVRGRGVTSLQRILDQVIPMEDVAASVIRAFGDVLDFSMEPVAPQAIFRANNP